MKDFTFEIRDAAGLHARPAGALVKEAKKYQSRITLSANGKTASAGRLMALLSMGLRCGTAVRFEIEGEDEEECAAAVRAFAEQNL